ncbi:MAG: DUF4982 domain-containing protein [Muribaculaceae bacterium]|nr:DUF4982 domain-containing protein [Muribaculaceae bacterium]
MNSTKLILASRRLLAVLLFQVCLISTSAAHLSTGVAENFNSGWLFSLDGDSVAPSAPDYDDSGWRRLDLPHDWSIELLPSPSLNACTGFFPGGVGWYRKHFTIDRSDDVHYLYFEGVYNRSEVYVNGVLAGRRPNGYISFYYDITPLLRDGDNVVAVRVDHSREADSRWYTGSGIYRDVYMVRACRTHFSPWALGWRATSIDKDRATVEVDFATDSPSRNTLKVSATLVAPDGGVAAHKEIKTKGGDKGSLSLAVDSPRRWDVDTPELYSLVLELYDGSALVDSASCRVGLRTLAFSPDEGFELNGRNIKVKGVCLHHDAGVLGAVVPEQVWRRRLGNLKEIGVNAIRMSHNPQAPVVYDLCDELGLLVMDEASDEWEFPKRKWVTGWNVGTPKFEGSYDFFEEWIERDVADMVRRDRNHPCGAFWSIGNEVDYPNDPYSHPVLDHSGISQHNYGGYDPDAPDASRIGLIAQRLAAVVRSIDKSRPVTGALAGVVMSNETAYPEAVDIVGYNYTEDRYATDHAAYPARVIYGSENGHSYDAWLAVRDNAHIFGQFLWTGADYLGESNEWPSRGLGTGLLDFASYLKPRGKFRASLWQSEPVAYLGAYPATENAPEASIDAPDIWNYADGTPMRVVCYTNCATARLSIDGDEAGAEASPDSRHGMIVWDIPFRTGALTVEAYDKEGKAVASDTLYTTGRPYALQASVERDGMLAHVTVEVVDENGRRVPLADNMISCRAEGAELLGLESPGNTDMTHPRATSRRASGGRVLAYVKLSGGENAARVICSSPLLKGLEIEL